MLSHVVFCKFMNHWMALLPHRRKGSWKAEKSIWEQHQDFWWGASLAMPPSLPTGKTFMMVGSNCILVYQNSWYSSSNTTKKLQFFLMSNSLSCHHGTCENVCNFDWTLTASIERLNTLPIPIKPTLFSQGMWSTPSCPSCWKSHERPIHPRGLLVIREYCSVLKVWLYVQESVENQGINCNLLALVSCLEQSMVFQFFSPFKKGNRYYVCTDIF